MKHNFSELLYLNFSILTGQKGYNSPESIYFCTALDDMDPAEKSTFIEYRNTYLNTDILINGIADNER